MTVEHALVLIVEDEPQIRKVLRITLEANAFRCVEATTGREGISAARNHRPDLIVIDLGLPDMDGGQIIREVRAWSQIPIVVLSARIAETEKIKALDAGADDYVTKPFNTGELLARLRVALRHAAARGREAEDELFQCGELCANLLQRKITMRGNEVHLTPIEFRILIVLIRKAGQVVTHSELLREVWGPGKEDEHHYLRIYMAGLRRKIETDSARPEYLQTEVGIGYRLMAAE